jgi:prepilin-type N-terminal cleavage/methylation domain-containing protein
MNAARPSTFERTRGFTMLELIVAISIFAVLGLLLMGLLRQAIEQWQRGENQREVYERAHSIFERVGEDLGSTFARGGPRAGQMDSPLSVKFLCDNDAQGRHRLRLVRTFKGEDADPAAASAGKGRMADGYTGHLTRRDDVKKQLRPLQGLAEVAYFLRPGPGSTELMRAERSPIGGPESLFASGQIDTAEQAEPKALPVADGVLLCRFMFWSQYTTTWDTDTPPGTELGDSGGPTVFWDSTRGILSRPPNRRSKRPAVGWFELGLDPTSLTDPIDDIWPIQARCELILSSFGVTEAVTFLAADLSSKERDRDVEADGTDNFPSEPPAGVEMLVLRIGDEWMQYTAVYGGGFKLGKRGLFGSVRRAHPKGTEVRAGLYFVRSYEIPAARNYWNK